MGSRGGQGALDQRPGALVRLSSFIISCIAWHWRFVIASVHRRNFLCISGSPATTWQPDSTSQEVQCTTNSCISKIASCQMGSLDARQSFLVTPRRYLTFRAAALHSSSYREPAFRTPPFLRNQQPLSTTQPHKPHTPRSTHNHSPPMPLPPTPQP